VATSTSSMEMDLIRLAFFSSEIKVEILSDGIDGNEAVQLRFKVKILKGG
jgi:hypothetical protein